MARPTAGTLTGAGYAQTGLPTSRYTKAQVTATLVVDIGNNNVSTGVTAIQATTPGTPITPADFTAAANQHATVGALNGIPTSCDTGHGLVYFGTTV